MIGHNPSVVDTSACVADLLANEQSLYSLLCAHYARWFPNYVEVRDTVGSFGLTSIFHLTDKNLARLSERLGLPFSTVRRLAGRDLASHDDCRGLLYGDLRYCPTCLSNRIHSPVFQHVAVERCPQHGCALVRNCHHCAFPIPLDNFGLSKNPFACGKCGVILGAYLEPHQALNIVDLVAFDDWHSALAPIPGTESSRNFIARCCETPIHLRGGRGVSPSVARRHLAWGGPPCFAASRTGDEKFHIRCSHGERFRTPAELIRDIQTSLEAVVRIDPAPTIAPAVRTREGLSVATAAFWSTVNAYVSPSDYERGRAGATDVPRTFGHLPIGWPRACEQLMQFEMIGLMARQVLGFSRLRFSAEIDWEVLPEPDDFAPAWLLRRGADISVLQCRPVATLASLCRLVRRYGNKPLDAAYYSPLVQGLVRAETQGTFK